MWSAPLVLLLLAQSRAGPVHNYHRYSKPSNSLDSLSSPLVHIIFIHPTVSTHTHRRPRHRDPAQQEWTATIKWRSRKTWTTTQARAGPLPGLASSSTGTLQAVPELQTGAIHPMVSITVYLTPADSSSPPAQGSLTTWTPHCHPLHPSEPKVATLLLHMTPTWPQPPPCLTALPWPSPSDQQVTQHCQIHVLILLSGWRLHPRLLCSTLELV